MTDIPHFDVSNIQWHDDQGHIFKDKLIEVFNAIEEKINFISSYQFGDTEKIDISSVVYPDVEEQDVIDGNDKIINFKSFVQLTNLPYFPLEVITDGNVKVISVKFIDSNYELVEAKPEGGIIATTEYPFIHINDDGTLGRYSTFQEYKELVACLKDNTLITGGLKIPGNINFLKILAHQAKNSISNTVNLDDGKSQRYGEGFTLGGGIGSKNGYNKNHITYTDIFRNNSGIRSENWKESEQEEE